MKVETIEILEKTKFGKEVKNTPAAKGCCGGAPVQNEEACCKLDEDKKAEGESGCGCNSTPSKSSSSYCG